MKFFTRARSTEAGGHTSSGSLLKIFSVLALLAAIFALPAWSQQVSFSTSSLVEGPGADQDAFIVYLTGAVSVNPYYIVGANWIQLVGYPGTSGNITLNNGPNRVKFVLEANTGATRSAPVNIGGQTLIVTQAGSSFVPAGRVLLASGLQGPFGIATDSSNDVWIASPSTGELLIWSGATQQVTQDITNIQPPFYPMAVEIDKASDVFVLAYNPTSLQTTIYEKPNGSRYYSQIFERDSLASQGFCIDPAGQNLHIADGLYQTSCVIDAFGNLFATDQQDNQIGENPTLHTTDNGNATETFTQWSRGIGVTNTPYGISADNGGYIYYLDNNGVDLSRFDPDNFSVTPIQQDIPGTYYTAVDSARNIYLSQTFGGNLQEIPKAYVSSATVGEPSSAGSDSLQVLPASQPLNGVYAPLTGTAPWLSVTSAANGSVNFAFAANQGLARSGVIRVLGVLAIVSQAAAPNALPAGIAITGNGDYQNAGVGGSGFLPLQVVVLDANGTPYPNANVLWQASGGLTFADGSGSSETLAVNSVGQGSQMVNAPPSPGTYTVTASLPGTNISVTFNLTGFIFGVSSAGGNAQSTLVNQAFPENLSTLVLDTNSNPVAGVSVTFSIAGSGASGSFSGTGSSVTVATGSNGIATAPPLIANGTLGSFAVTASASGLPSGATSQTTFNLTNTGTGVFLAQTNEAVGPGNGSSSIVLGNLPLGQSASWSASTSSGWIHLAAASGATTPATVIFNYDSNPGVTRTGTIVFNGGAATLTVTQAGSNYLAGSQQKTLFMGQQLGVAHSFVPGAMAVDGNGNIYITVTGGISEWDPATELLTAIPSVGEATDPQWLALDPSGNVYFTELGNYGIFEWNRTTQQSSRVDNGSAGQPAMSLGVAVNGAGNVYIADNFRGQISEFNPATKQITLAASIEYPVGIAVDAAGDVYMSANPYPASYGIAGNYIVEWNPGTQQLSRLASLTSGSSLPGAVAVDAAGNVYIADAGNNAIKEWSPSTQQLTTLVSNGLSGPTGVAVDSDGNVDIADTGNNALKQFTSAFVGPTSLSEPSTAGTDNLLPVLPSGTHLMATSDQPWLTIGTQNGDVLSFSFSANPGTTARVAHINVLGQSIPVTQGAPQTVGLTGPSSALYNSTFSVYTFANSGAAATLSVVGGPCQVSGTNVLMTAGTGICQLQAAWPAAAPYGPASATLSVAAAPIIVTPVITVANKVFDGTTTATVTGCSLVGNIVPADASNLTCSASAASFASAGLGVNITVTATSVTLGGSAAGNYALFTSTPVSVPGLTTVISAPTAIGNANITAATQPNACVASPTGITAWWNGNGNANDATGQYNGTLGGTATFATGLVGQAFSFDGSQTPYVALPAGAFPSEPSASPFTFETWFQAPAATGVGVILGAQSGLPYSGALGGWTPAIYVGADGLLNVQMFYSTNGVTPIVSANPVNDGQWHHVAVTFDGSNEIVYLDGASIGTITALTQASLGTPLSFQLGTGFTESWPDLNGQWITFNGLIDEATVYSRALGAGEVIGIAEAGSYGKCNPVASLAVSSLNFSSISAGQSATLTTQVNNTGNSPLAISSLNIDAGDVNFTVLNGSSGDCTAGTPVAPNMSCNVRVQFAPQTSGVATGTVTIVDNSLYGGGQQTIALVGSSLLIPVVTFTGPSSAVYGSTFTPVSSTNSGATPTITTTGPCQVNGTSVTMTGGTGTCEIEASWPATSSYMSATATLNVNATAIIVTPTVTVANKVFDGTTSGALGSCALSNVLPADAANVGCTASSVTFASAGVDNNIPVTVNGIALTGSAAQNYQLSVSTLSSAGNIVFVSVDNACISSPPGVAAWWKGDGNANDATGNYNGTLGGDASFAPGKVGQAFSFDGTQSPYVALPAGAFPPQPSNGPFTFESWFQTAGAAGGVILGQQSGPVYEASVAGWTPGVYVGMDGKLYAQMFFASNNGVEAVVSSIQVNDGNWHHVAVTYDGSTEIVYLDGGVIGTISSLSQAPNGSNISYELGTGYTVGWPAGNNGWYTFNGLIDEATVYSRALSAAEVQSIAQASGYGKCNPAVSLSPNTLNFNSVSVGQSGTLTAVLSNPGNVPVTIANIATDAGDANFSIAVVSSGDCSTGAPVAAGSSCNVRVQFAPQTGGQFTGTVIIQDNSINNAGTQTIQLAGNVQVTPVVTFTGPISATYGAIFAPALTTNAGVSATIMSTGGPCQVNGANVTMTAGIGTCQLQASWPANPPYVAASATLSVSATPLSVTPVITAANKTFDGTTTATVSSCTLTNVLPADAANVTCPAAGATFASPGVDNNIPVTATGITLAGSAAANYQLSATTATTTANIAFGSTDTSCIASPSGVTAWFKGEGNANDATGTFNGTLGGDVSFAAGKVGQAFSFDGTQSPYVTLPAGALPAEPGNGPFSFETWFQTSTGGVILGQQSGPVYGPNPDGWTPGVYVGTDGNLHAQMFYAANNGIEQIVSAIPVNDGHWHHVAVTYDGSTETVYLDGGIIGTISSLSQAQIGPNVSYQLGTGYTLGWPAANEAWYTFTGMIDEATVYSRALSAAEVANIVQAETNGKCNPGAVANPATLSFGNVNEG